MPGFTGAHLAGVVALLNVEDQVASIVERAHDRLGVFDFTVADERRDDFVELVEIFVVVVADNHALQLETLKQHS